MHKPAMYWPNLRSCRGIYIEDDVHINGIYVALNKRKMKYSRVLLICNMSTVKSQRHYYIMLCSDINIELLRKLSQYKCAML